jgi:hypothetical protein
MPLQLGARLRPCHVTAKIGEGGKGEVYRAHPKASRVRICAKKVVAGVRFSARLPNTRPVNTRQFA